MKQKTIVIEALSALQGGGQTYLLNLFENIPNEWAGKYRIVAIIPVQLANKMYPGFPIEIHTSKFADQGLVQRILWLWFQLPKVLQKYDADVCYYPGGLLFAHRQKGLKTAVAFQNMLPFDPVASKRHPRGYRRARLSLLRFLQSVSFNRADLVIFISNYARHIIDQLLPERPGHSVVIYHGVSEDFRHSVDSPRQLHGIEYVLYVSTLHYYKAQMEVLLAWAKLRLRRKTSEKLVLVGPEDASYGVKLRDLIKSLKLVDEVMILGEKPHKEMPAHYQHAKINLFASTCENCPNILLEAMASGSPVLCSCYQPMPEIGGDAVAYFNPHDPEELAGLLMRYLDDPDLRQRMGEAAKKRSTLYRWPASAVRTWISLAELIGQPCAE